MNQSEIPKLPQIKQLTIPELDKFKQVVYQTVQFYSDNIVFEKEAKIMFQLRSKAFQDLTTEAFLAYYQQVKALSKVIQIPGNYDFSFNYEIANTTFNYLDLNGEVKTSLFGAIIASIVGEDYGRALQLISQLLQLCKTDDKMFSLLSYIQFYTSILNIQQRMDLQKYQVGDQLDNVMYNTLMNQMYMVENYQKIIYNYKGMCNLQLGLLPQIQSYAFQRAKLAREQQDLVLKSLFEQQCPRFLKQRLGIDVEVIPNRIMADVPDYNKIGVITTISKDSVPFIQDYHKRYTRMQSEVSEHNAQRIQELLGQNFVQNVSKQLDQLKKNDSFAKEQESIQIFNDKVQVTNTKLRAMLISDDMQESVFSEVENLQQSINQLDLEFQQRTSSALSVQVQHIEDNLQQLMQIITQCTPKSLTFEEFIQSTELSKLSYQVSAQKTDLVINQYLQKNFQLNSQAVVQLQKEIQVLLHGLDDVIEPLNLTDFEQKLDAFSESFFSFQKPSENQAEV